MADKNVNVKISAQDNASSKFGGFIKKITSLKGLMVGALGFGALKKAISSVTQAAGIQEDAIATLNQQLRANKQFNEQVSQSLQDHASSLQDVTTFGDEATIVMQANLLQFKINTAQAKKYTESVLDLATAKKLDLTAAAKLVGLAAEGETSMLKRYGIVIDSNIKGTDKFAAVMDKISEKFGGAARAAAKTYTGQMQQLKNVVGDLFETLGAFITQNRAVRDAIGIMVGAVKVAINGLEGFRKKMFSSRMETDKATKSILDQRDALDGVGRQHVILEFTKDLQLANAEIEKTKKTLREIEGRQIKLPLQALEEKNALENYTKAVFAAIEVQKKLNNVKADKRMVAGLKEEIELLTQEPDVIEEVTQADKKRTTLAKIMAATRLNDIMVLFAEQKAAEEKLAEEIKVIEEEKTLARESGGRAALAQANERLSIAVTAAQKELQIRQQLMTRLAAITDAQQREELEAENQTVVERALLYDKYEEKLSNVRKELEDVSTAEGLEKLVNDYERLKNLTKDTAVGEDLAEELTAASEEMTAKLEQLGRKKLNIGINKEELVSLAGQAGKESGEAFKREFERVTAGLQAQYTSYLGQGG